jgi:hypothetical protein
MIGLSGYEICGKDEFARALPLTTGAGKAI